MIPIPNAQSEGTASLQSLLRVSQLLWLGEDSLPARPPPPHTHETFGAPRKGDRGSCFHATSAARANGPRFGCLRWGILEVPVLLNLARETSSSESDMRTHGQRPAAPPASAGEPFLSPAQMSSHLCPPPCPQSIPPCSLWLRRQGSCPPAPTLPGTLCRWQVTGKSTPNWGSAPPPLRPVSHPTQRRVRHELPPTGTASLPLASRGLWRGAGERKNLSPPFHPGSRALPRDAKHPAHGGPSACTPSPAPWDALEGASLLCQPSSLPQQLPVPSPRPRRQGDAPPAQASSAEFFQALAAAVCWGSHTRRHPWRGSGV